MSATPTTRMGGRVVIIGGGIAGLFTAITLCPYFDAITIIERGEYSDSPAVRAHAPQGAHVHILLSRGLKILSEQIPELPKWMDELGLPEKDLTQDVHVRTGTKWLPQHPSGIRLRPCTRPVLEHLLLRAARQRTSITIHENTKVTGLRFEGGRVVGIDARRGESPEEEYTADLVIGAGGRSTKMLEWLRDHSIEVPEETVNPHVLYSSCSFRPQPGKETDWTIVARNCQFPAHPEMAAIMNVGGERWLAALVCYGDVPPPKTTADIVERVAGLLGEPYATDLRSAEPTTEVSHFGNTANRMRYFAKVASWPDRLLVIGDSVCTLNPRYGQGMTLSALAAETLRTELLDHWKRSGTLDGFSQPFQRALEKALKTPWQMALLEDRLWIAQHEGRRLTFIERMASNVSKRMVETVFTDFETYVRFMKVAHMLESPAYLMNPSTMAKVAIPRFRRNLAQV